MGKKNGRFAAHLSYAFAILSSLLAGLLTRWVDPFFGDTSFFEFFHVAVVLSAFLGGLGPGMLSAVSSFLVLDYFYIPPVNQFILGPHLVRLVLFEAVAVLTSLLSGKLKEAKGALERAHDTLEKRIKERTEELSGANNRLLKEVAHRQEAEKAILEVSAREQRRLGQDLHDGLCQTIAGLRLMVEGARRNSVDGSRDLKAIEDRLTEALDQSYTVSKGLYPVELETGGLLAALEDLAVKTSKLYSIECFLRSTGSAAVRDPGVATHLFRIAQEAVINAIKSGKAVRIKVSLLDRGGETVLRVADNGIGLGNEPLRNGMGIKMMEYRAQVIEAALSFRSRRRGGTLVTCVFRTPAGPEDDHAA